MKIKRALISVYDKTGVVDFARALSEDLAIEIISTGGTARTLDAAGIPAVVESSLEGALPALRAAVNEARAAGVTFDGHPYDYAGGGTAEFVHPGEKVEEKVLRHFERIAGDFPREVHEAFETILNFTPRFVIGSLLAYLISQSFDVWIFHRIKRRTGESRLWLRNNLSTMSSQIVDTLLAHLSLLFVPAGVGVMLHVAIVSDQWLAIGVALIVSTILTLIVTALVMTVLTRWVERKDSN